MGKKKLTDDQRDELLNTLKTRFEKNMKRHQGLEWAGVVAKMENQPEKLQTLNQMEETGGEPDVIGYDQTTDEYLFYDCSPESPKGRRSVCYDRDAWEARKKY
jgi:hypothetical protein